MHDHRWSCWLAFNGSTGELSMSNYTGCDAPMSWRGQEARVAAYRGKVHWKKSGPGIAVARGEFGELTKGELTRFYCIYIYMYISVKSTILLYILANTEWKLFLKYCTVFYLHVNAMSDEDMYSGILL